MSAGSSFGTTTTRVSSESLIASRQEQVSIFSGTRIIEDVDGIVQAFHNKSWLDGTLNTVGLVADTVSAFMDPIGEAFAMGIAWVLDHIEPLKGWMNELTGDAASVSAASQTWARVAEQMNACAQDAINNTQRFFSSQYAQTINAFMTVQSDASLSMGAAAQLASAVSGGLAAASMLVQIVHDLVRDAIADIIGTIASMAFWEVVSLGIATPYVVSVVVGEVAKWSVKLGSKMTALVRSFDNLARLIARASDSVADVAQKAAKAVKNVPTTAARKASDAFDAVKKGAKTVKTNAQRGINAANALTHGKPWEVWKSWRQDPEAFRAFLSKVMDPQYTTDVVTAGRKSATELLPEILSSPKMRKLYDDLGIEAWDMDTFRSKAYLHADSPDLSSADRHLLGQIRQEFGPVSAGDYMSKYNLSQDYVPDLSKRPGGFMAESPDVAGLNGREAFDALAGDYYIEHKHPETGEVLGAAPNEYTHGRPMYETRFQADEQLAKDLGAPYAPEMGIAQKKRSLSVADGNKGYDGPFTGTGFTASHSERVVPEYLTFGDKRTTPIFQEMYDTSTGRRVAIGIELPWAPGKNVHLPVFR